MSGRRKFLLKVVHGVGYYAFGAVAWGVYLKQAQANSDVLRPPGAMSEADFVKTCIRCGICVEVCPYDALKLSKISDQISLGTPFYEPRLDPCKMCIDIPCASSCPTDALQLSSLIKKEEEPSINNAKMGLALINTQTCLAYLGLQCTMCFQACPLTGDAIFLHKERNERTDMHAFLKPVVDPAVCTGCGMCEHACPTTYPSIFIKPLSSISGDVGSHYIVGWDKDDVQRAKESAGDSRMQRTKRNERSALDNVNDVDGILEGLYE